MSCSYVVFLFKQKTAYEMRISDWSSDVCSSDLADEDEGADRHQQRGDAARDRVDPREVAPLVGQRQEIIVAVVDDRGSGDVGPGGQRRRQIGRASCRERVCQYV